MDLEYIENIDLKLSNVIKNIMLKNIMLKNIMLKNIIIKLKDIKN